jgi:hypothetical protein
MLKLAIRHLVRVFKRESCSRFFINQVLQVLLFFWRQYYTTFACARWTQLRLLEFLIFFSELDLIRRRSLCSMKFLLHPSEAASYFRIWGFPLHKPDYMFKVFDKLHSVFWPNSNISTNSSGERQSLS